MLGGLFSASLRENWGSTYICPGVRGLALRIKVVQGICVALDLSLIIIAAELSRRENRIYDGKEIPFPILLGYIYLVRIHRLRLGLNKSKANRTRFNQGVALFWTAVGFLVLIIDEDLRQWILSPEPAFKRSVITQALLFALLTISVTKIVSCGSLLLDDSLLTSLGIPCWCPRVVFSCDFYLRIHMGDVNALAN